MTRRRMTPLLASFLSATVMAPAAFAQTAEELAAGGQSCEALAALHTEQANVLREEWIETTGQAIEAGDQAQCLEYYEQAVTELAQLEQGEGGETAPVEGTETAEGTETTPAQGEGTADGTATA